jgi:hypothetical protein
MRSVSSGGEDATEEAKRVHSHEGRVDSGEFADLGCDARTLARDAVMEKRSSGIAADHR